MDLVEKVVREACARSPDGKITPLDFTNHASRTMRYGTFSPMEVAIIFHFSRQGVSDKDKPRLGLRDFGSLLDAKWGPPRTATTTAVGAGEQGKVKRKAGNAMHEIGKVCRDDLLALHLVRARLGARVRGTDARCPRQSAYYFGLGGIAGALGATAGRPASRLLLWSSQLTGPLALPQYTPSTSPRCARAFSQVPAVPRLTLPFLSSSRADPHAEPALQGRRRAAVQELARLRAKSVQERGLCRVLPRPATAAHCAFLLSSGVPACLHSLVR